MMNKAVPSNEIKVALIGHVSAGKTTVLNAIFREKYGEVSMRRTTAAVNYFRISSSAPEQQGQDGKSQASKKKSGPRSPTLVLEEITKDNAEFRKLSTSCPVLEKHFDIELKETLFEMYGNTTLVLVDVPGINEAGTSSKYKDYVCDKWHTFDCVVVVMDGRQGVNTDEQMDLVKLVKENQKNRELPVIFLCNKIDVPEDEEQQLLVQEAREAIQSEFNLTNCEETLNQVLAPENQKKENPKRKHVVGNKTYPLFITISAIHAFIYQSASIMSFEEFQKFDEKLIERFGREYFGRKWRHFKTTQKYAEAYEALKDPDECKVGLEQSNFDKFLGALGYTVGGKERQLYLLKSKLEDAILRLTGNERLISDLESILVQREGLNIDQVDDLHSKFWSLYTQAMAGAFVEFENPRKVASLASPMTMLIDYHALCKKCDWINECELVVVAMKKLLCRQFSVVFEKWSEWSLEAWKKKARTEVACWEDLSPWGWESLLSLMLLIDEAPLLVYFGYEKITLESMLHQCRSFMSDLVNIKYAWCPDCNHEVKVCGSNSFQCTNCDKFYYSTLEKANRRLCPLHHNSLGENDTCRSCGMFVSTKAIIRCESAVALEYKDGTWKRRHPKLYECLNGIPRPKGGVSEPLHFGHLLWKFCRFLSDQDETKWHSHNAEHLFEIGAKTHSERRPLQA